MAAHRSYPPGSPSLRNAPVSGGAPRSAPPSTHRRRQHTARHRLEEHRVARTAAAGAAGAVVIGAAFGLTSGSLSGPAGPAPTGTALDAALDARAEQSVSRGLARAALSPAAGEGAVSLAQGPAASPPAQQPGTTGAPLPDVPADCEEYSGNRQIGCTLLSEFGFGLDQMPALDELWSHESGWNHRASNPSTGAYGIPQALPGNKMASVADDWETNPATQIRWGLGYIKDRYGSPDAAWSFFQSNGWY